MEYIKTIQYCNLGGLTEALKTAIGGNKIDGLSASIRPSDKRLYSKNNDNSETFDQLRIGTSVELTANELTTLDGALTAHDPVFLSVDKTSITADGTEQATISVHAPKTGAAGVTLVCTKPDGTTQTEAITLTAGVGAMTLATFIEGKYRIAVQTPANRSADQIVIEAV